MRAALAANNPDLRAPTDAFAAKAAPTSHNPTTRNGDRVILGLRRG